MSTNLSGLPASQVIASTGTIYLGATANPVDVNADYIYHPSAAGRSFVVDTSSTQPFIIRQIGGVVGTNESKIYHDGLDIIIKNMRATDGTCNLRVQDSQSNYTVAVIAKRFSTGANSNIFESGSLGLGNATTISWNGNADGSGKDTATSRATSAVIRTTDSAGGTVSWLQNTAGEACLNANFTNATAVLANTNLLFNVIAGRVYRIEGVLQVSDSTAGEGSQFDFNGGTCTATTFFVALSSVGTVVAGTVIATALNGVLNYTSNTGTDYIFVRGFLKVNAGGTLIFRAAQNSHSTGTLTLGAGSWLALRDSVAL